MVIWRASTSAVGSSSRYTRTWVDGDGVQHTENGVRRAADSCSCLRQWKPVDAISPEALVSEDENYIIVPVPYDQGERIAYRYEKRYDYQRIKQQVADLKQALTDSDYKVMKCYEASMLGQPYALRHRGRCTRNGRR